MQTILFFILSAIVLGSALTVVLTRNPIYSVLALIVSFFAIAGHYVLLNAPFLAAVQVIVYAGAIMVLFLFTLMLMNLNHESAFFRPRRWGFFSIGLVTLFSVMMIFFLSGGPGLGVHPSTVLGTAKALGHSLFTTFLIPFELSSLLFLAAVVSVVMIGTAVKGNKEGPYSER